MPAPTTTRIAVQHLEHPPQGRRCGCASCVAARSCSFISGPCVDGTMAGRRCGALVTTAGRCARHALTPA